MSKPHMLSNLRFASPLALALVAASLPAQWAGEWKFDETSGTTAADSAPNKNDGALINFTTGQWGPGKFGGALTFDGVDDYVDLPIGKGLPVYGGQGQPYSICFWVNGSPTDDDRVYSEGSTLSNTPIMTIGTGRTSLTNTDKLQLYFRNDNGLVVLNAYSNATVFDNTWHHVAWVDASGRTSLYIDGKLDSQNHYTVMPGTAQFGTFTTDKASAGGIIRAAPCCHFTGAMDDLRVYQFALKAIDLPLVMQNIPLIPLAGSIGYYGDGCNGYFTIWGSGSTAPGGTLNLSVSRGTGGRPVQLVVGAPIAPFDLGNIGFPGCTLYPALQTSLIIGIGTLDAAGTISPIPLQIPNQSSLNGVLGAMQAAALSANDIELTNALLLHVGR